MSHCLPKEISSVKKSHGVQHVIDVKRRLKVQSTLFGAAKR